MTPLRRCKGLPWRCHCLRPCACCEAIAQAWRVRGSARIEFNSARRSGDASSLGVLRLPRQCATETVPLNLIEVILAQGSTPKAAGLRFRSVSRRAWATSVFADLPSLSQLPMATLSSFRSRRRHGAARFPAGLAAADPAPGQRDRQGHRGRCPACAGFSDPPAKLPMQAVSLSAERLADLGITPALGHHQAGRLRLRRLQRRRLLVAAEGARLRPRQPLQPAPRRPAHQRRDRAVAGQQGRLSRC